MLKHAEEIRPAREARGLSQFRLAKLLSVPSTKLSAWELGKAIPSSDDLQRIQAILEGLDQLISNGELDLRRRSASTHSVLKQGIIR